MQRTCDCTGIDQIISLINDNGKPIVSEINDKAEALLAILTTLKTQIPNEVNNGNLTPAQAIELNEICDLVNFVFDCTTVIRPVNKLAQLQLTEVTYVLSSPRLTAEDVADLAEELCLLSPAFDGFIGILNNEITIFSRLQHSVDCTSNAFNTQLSALIEALEDIKTSIGNSKTSVEYLSQLVATIQCTPLSENK